MAGKLWINADGCHLMTRHLYLWYHLDVIFGCVCHKLLHLLLGVIALDRHQHVVHVPTAACLGCQSRIFLDLDAPTLVVHEVEMHGIELVASHLWDECLELVEWDEGSHWVEHQLSDMRAWLIGYGGLHDGIAALLGAIATEQLVEGHQTIEYTSGSLSLDDNFLSLYVERVGFWVIKAFVQCQGEGELLRFVHLALVDSLAQDSERMFLFVAQTISRLDAPDAIHFERSLLLVYGQLHRNRNQTVGWVANFSRLFVDAIEKFPSLSFSVCLLASLRYDKATFAEVDA